MCGLNKIVRAFSLIELLVVISIMGILAALSFPAITKALNSSKTAICASNLRQIASGLNLYAIDNDGYYPLVRKKDATGQQDLWSYAIWTYVGYSWASFKYPDNDLPGNSGQDKNIFHCPVTKQCRAKNVSSIRMPKAKEQGGNMYSYMMNDAPSYVNSGNSYTPYRTTQIANPSKTALVLEQDESPANQFIYISFYGLIPHNKASNVLFGDGHVSLMQASDFPPARGFTDTGLSEFWSGKSN